MRRFDRRAQLAALAAILAAGGCAPAVLDGYQPDDPAAPGPTPTSSDPLPSGPGTPGGTDTCAQVQVALTPVIPNVQLLLDFSGSMNEKDFPLTRNGVTQTVSRWDALKYSLTDSQKGVLPTLDGRVRFGATLYSGISKSSPKICPLILEQPLAANNAANIASLLASHTPLSNGDGDTPTGESMDRLVSSIGLAPNPTSAASVIVLATDGDPDTCAAPDDNGGTGPRLVAVQAVQRARTANLPVYVLSVGNQTTVKHMQDLADAGAGLTVGGATHAQYYQASSTQGLIDGFNAVIRGARSCHATLKGSVQPGGDASGDVRLNGVKVPRDDANGWRLAGPSDLELVGAACDQLKQTDNVTLTATFACDAVVIL